MSLVLFLATSVLWVRSYWSEDAVVRQEGSKELWHAASSRGQIAIDHYQVFGEPNFENRRGRTWFFQRRNPTQLTLRPLRSRYSAVRGTVWAGFGFLAHDVTTVQNDLVTRRAWFVPHWLPALLTVALPIRRILWPTRRSCKSGHCLRCGYDLRATPGRCPECGTIPTR
jgi:hypothetical protein